MEYFDRNLNSIDLETFESLMKTSGYAELGRDIVGMPQGDIFVRTRWLGYDSRNDPPKIFATSILGDDRRGFVEELHSTEDDALRYHRSVTERYAEQRRVLRAGGSPILSDGVL